jgi:hypothetical protein
LRDFIISLAPSIVTEQDASHLNGWSHIRGPLHCDPNVIADYVAKYLISCALTVPHTDASSWYWSKAIDLLDRLCEIGPSEPRSGLDSAQVECAEAKLSQCVRPSIIAQIIAGGDLVVR